MLQRILLTVVEAYPTRFQSVSSYTDSLCSIGAICKTAGTLRPFFMNCILEIANIRETLAKSVDLLLPVTHIPGSLNPTDIGTRGQAQIKDLYSRWQTGPGNEGRPRGNSQRRVPTIRPQLHDLGCNPAQSASGPMSSPGGRRQPRLGPPETGCHHIRKGKSSSCRYALSPGS